MEKSAQDDAGLAAWRERIALARGFEPPADPAERAVYDVVASGFDIGFYLRRYPDIDRARKLDPVAHYIRAGAGEGRDPAPDFSTGGYLARYPDVASSGQNPFHHWLTRGRAAGRHAHPAGGFEDVCRWLGRAPADVAAELGQVRSDRRRALLDGDLGAQVGRAMAIDPDVGGAWPAVDDIGVQPAQSDLAVARLVAMQRLQAACAFRPANVVILTADAGAVLDPLLEAVDTVAGIGEVVLLRTGDAAPSLPALRTVALTECLSGLPPVAARRCLADAVRSLGPRLLVDLCGQNAESFVTVHGRALARSMTVFRFHAAVPTPAQVARDLAFCAHLHVADDAAAIAVRAATRLGPDLAARVTGLGPNAPTMRRAWAGHVGAHLRAAAP